MAARDDDVNFTAASEPLSAVLVEFFRKVAAGDEEIYGQLRSRFKSQVGGDRFYFTLPELYAFMTEQYEMFRDVDYRRFRKLCSKRQSMPLCNRWVLWWSSLKTNAKWIKRCMRLKGARPDHKPDLKAL